MISMLIYTTSIYLYTELIFKLHINLLSPSDRVRQVLQNSMNFLRYTDIRLIVMYEGQVVYQDQS